MRKIIIEDYKEEWERAFKQLKKRYEKALDSIDVRIEHVGSTSVKGLAAKPIIDIDIIVEHEQEKNDVIRCLSELGYHHQGDLGIKGREAFKRKSDAVPYDDTIKSWISHHLYVCINGIESVENHLLLRDYLRANRDAVTDYSNLKKQLARRFPYDIDSYIEGKTSFITNVLTKAGMSQQAINDITEQNKKK